MNTYPAEHAEYLRSIDDRVREHAERERRRKIEAADAVYSATMRAAGYVWDDIRKEWAKGFADAAREG